MMDMGKDDEDLSNQYREEELSKYAPGSQSSFTQFLIFLVAVTSAFLQGYQIGVIAGVELFVGDEH